MVLVHEAQGRRICLECQAVLEDGDELAWMAEHLGADGCDAQTTRTAG